MKKTFSILVLVLFSFSSGFAEDKPIESAPAAKTSYLMCKSGAVVRTIRVEKKNNTCRTTYTKDGVETTVGKSTQEELCYEVFEKIRSNLEKGNWRCKDISSSRVSYSE